MTDDATSNDQPEGDKPLDLEALVSQINAENEKRFRGFQSLLDRRDEEFRTTLEDLKNSGLSPEEREQATNSKLAAEVEQLRRRNEILSMRKEHPEEADLLDEFLQAGSLQDQIELLSKFRKAQAPAEPNPEQGGANEGGEPTPVDKNNPARKSQPSLEAAAAGMNKELSDQILAASGNDKGIMARLRRTS